MYFYWYVIHWHVTQVCFFEAVFEADLSIGLWRPPKECTHGCSHQQTSSSQFYFWIQPFKTVLTSWAYYIVRMMLLLKFIFSKSTLAILWLWCCPCWFSMLFRDPYFASTNARILVCYSAARGCIYLPVSPSVGCPSVPPPYPTPPPPHSPQSEAMIYVAFKCCDTAY